MLENGCRFSVLNDGFYNRFTVAILTVNKAVLKIVWKIFTVSLDKAEDFCRIKLKQDSF